MRRILAGIVAAAIACGAIPSVAQEKLAVWWGKGAYKSEDEALLAAIRKYEGKSGVKVELSLFAAQDMIPKLIAAADAGAPPDVAYSDVLDAQVAGKWAFDGKLDDVSDVMEPIKGRFAPAAVDAALLQNARTGKRAFYAVPLKQQILHVQYWKDMLAAAGFKENDIPGNWKDYWSFWCDRVQPAYRTATDTQVHGIGNPMGVQSADSARSFLSWIDAYNVRLVDDSGKLLVDSPEVRSGLIAALTDYVDLYLKGCTPGTSTAWKDPDNDAAFENRMTVMTHDYDFAIVARWLDDANNEKLTAVQRGDARKAYDQLIAISGFPMKPDGSPMVYRPAVTMAVIFEKSANKVRAREFVKFLLEEENLRPYVESSFGRWFPVTREGQKSPFWQADKHRKAIHDQFASGMQPSEFTRNYKFAALNTENLWAKAMNRVINDKVTVENAVDEMIARIKQVVN